MIRHRRETDCENFGELRGQFDHQQPPTGKNIIAGIV